LGKLKKIGIGIGLFIVGFFVLGIIVVAMNSGNDNASIQVEEQSIILTKNIEDVLPTREDAGTIWTITTRSIDTLEESGTDQRAGNLFRKGVAYSLTTVFVKAYLFNPEADINGYFDGLIGRIVEIGGYEEVNVNARDAKCYGTYKQGDFLEETYSYRCIKANVYARVTTISSDFDAKSLSSKFMRIVLDKIN